MSSSDHPHNHNYGSSPPDERIVRQKAQFGPHPAAATRGGHHQSSSASSMHPPPLLVLPPPSASLSAVSSSLMRNLHLHNPSPKPLGSDIQVVASVPVFSDPNLLQDQDSVLEFLGPLLLGGGGGPAENQKPMTIREAGNHEKLNKHPPFPHAPSQKKRRRTTSTTSSSSHFVDDPPTYHWEGMSASSTASKQDSCLLVDEYRTKKRRSSSGNNSNSKGDQEVGLTDHQAALWDRRFQELIDYRQRFGHCLVPHKWPENLALATWVKRQRYQWKLRGQGKRSTLTQERHDALSELGFVWDSHSAAWEERFNELVDYKRVHGHTSVPSTDKNHSLSVWVQCQRRQWKLMKEETAESKETAGYRMKENRVERLEALGFVWEPRKQQQQQEGGK